MFLIHCTQIPARPEEHCNRLKMKILDFSEIAARSAALVNSSFYSLSWPLCGAGLELLSAECNSSFLLKKRCGWEEIRFAGSINLSFMSLIRENCFWLLMSSAFRTSSLLLSRSTDQYSGLYSQLMQIQLLCKTKCVWHV